jgi:pseudouridine kinase
VRAPRVTVFGAVAMDTRLQSRGPVVPATSNPVAAGERPGGVGHNLATTLAGLGVAVTLASRIGADATGDALVAGLTAAGIATDAVTRSTTRPTARYWAVIEPTGELALGLADMAVLDELEPEILAPAMAVPADAWLVDCNLPAASIAHLLENPQRPTLVAVDTVSTAKAPRIAPHLARIDLLFTNEAEALALLGAAGAQALRAAGAATVVMSRGAHGLEIADAAGLRHLPALAVATRDVTGAGDALAAATLYALLAGFDLGLAARVGRLAATAVLMGRPLAGTADLRDLASALDNGLHEQLARLQP